MAKRIISTIVMNKFTADKSSIVSRYKDVILFSKIMNIDSKDYSLRQNIELFILENEDWSKSIETSNNLFINFDLRWDIPVATQNISTSSFEEKKTLEMVEHSFDTVIYMKLQNLVEFNASEFRNKLYVNRFLVRVDVHCDNIYFTGKHVYFGVDPFHTTNTDQIIPSVLKYKLLIDPIHIYYVLDFWNQYYLNISNPVVRKLRIQSNEYDNLLDLIQSFWNLMRTFSKLTNREKLKTLIILSQKLLLLNKALGAHLGIILSNFSPPSNNNTVQYNQEQSLPAIYTHLLYITAHFQIISNIINVCAYLMLNFYTDIDAKNFNNDSTKDNLFTRADHLTAIQEYILYGNEFYLCFTPSLTPIRREILAALDISHIDIEDYVTSSSVYVPTLKVSRKSIKLTDNSSYKFFYTSVSGFHRLQKYLHFLYNK